MSVTSHYGDAAGCKSLHVYPIVHDNMDGVCAAEHVQSCPSCASSALWARHEAVNAAISAAFAAYGRIYSCDPTPIFAAYYPVNTFTQRAGADALFRGVRGAVGFDVCVTHETFSSCPLDRCGEAPRAFCTSAFLGWRSKPRRVEEGEKSAPLEDVCTLLLVSSFCGGISRGALAQRSTRVDSRRRFASASSAEALHAEGHGSASALAVLVLCQAACSLKCSPPLWVV